MSRERKTKKKTCSKCGAVKIDPYRMKGRIYRRRKLPKGYSRYNGCKCPEPSWNEWWEGFIRRRAQRPPVEPYEGLNKHDAPETAKDKARRKARTHRIHQGKDKR